MWMGDEKDEKSNKLFNCYLGEFQRGLRQGQGTFYYASGAMYMVCSIVSLLPSITNLAYKKLIKTNSCLIYFVRIL